MFVVTVQFKTNPADHEAFLRLVTRNAALSLRDEPGCHRFDVCAGDPGEVFLYELYRDASAFEAHKRADHYHAFNANSADLVTGKSVSTYTLHPQVPA